MSKQLIFKILISCLRDVEYFSYSKVYFFPFSFSFSYNLPFTSLLFHLSCNKMNCGNRVAIVFPLDLAVKVFGCVSGNHKFVGCWANYLFQNESNQPRLWNRDKEVILLFHFFFRTKRPLLYSLKTNKLRDLLCRLWTPN